MTILFLGDIVAKNGRRAVMRILPKWKKKYTPDLIVANIENLAHGKGVTEKTLAEMYDLGITVFTSGNHIWSNEMVFSLFEKNTYNGALLRPENYPSELPGSGLWQGMVGKKHVSVMSLIGRGFMPGDYDCPFRAFDRLWEKVQKDDIILVDFHAETTSEKAALAWYVDGRATAVMGTHTHVPTADARKLTKGTFFITDVGMCGFSDGIIGVQKEEIIASMMLQYRQHKIWPEKGNAVVNGIVMKFPQRKGGKATFTHVHDKVKIS